jgi:hypothetical protein
MKTSNFVNYLLAIAAAYCVVLALPIVLDFAFDTDLALITIIWINVGVFVMRAKKMHVPLPDSRRIDVGGGVRLLWWALFWPRYMLAE